ncbi:alkaline-phosphatase-like protein [Obelidium mucronatum]|nr:alkaline-phosphatase-like protein [Obelidium mucronatum]
MMWPGSEAPIHNTRPTYYQPYNGSMSNSDRVSQIISWISLPIESRPAFLTLYISDIDTAGHKYGPNSPQVNAALKAVDSNIGTLIEGVMKAQSATSLQASNVNIVVVSDHGMAPGNPVNGFIYLDDIVDEKLFTMVNNVVCFIYPKDPSKTKSILEAFQKASLESTHWNVWARDEVPDTFHFSKNKDRIGPIVALPKQGYALALRSVISAKLNASQPVTLGGMHGYNNSNVDMRAIFIAAGPAFKSSERVLGTTSNSTEAVAVWEVDGGQLDVDTEGHIVVALHGGAAVGGELGIHQRDFEYIKSGGLKRDGDAASSTLVVSPMHSTTSSLPSLSASSSAAASSNIASQVTPPVHSAQASSESAAPNGAFIALQMIPHFENVEIYNLILRVLKLSGRGAANNGTKAGMDLFEPWLNY